MDKRFSVSRTFAINEKPVFWLLEGLVSKLAPFSKHASFSGEQLSSRCFKGKLQVVEFYMNLGWRDCYRLIFMPLAVPKCYLLPFSLLKRPKLVCGLNTYSFGCLGNIEESELGGKEPLVDICSSITSQ